MKKNLYKFMLRSWLMLLAVALPTVALADDEVDPNDVSDAESALMAGKKVNAPVWQETDPSVGSDPALTNTPYLKERRALVGYNCQINRLTTAVGVGVWSEDIENLVDDDIDNDATFPGVVNATVALSPIVSVRDLDNYYAAGTTVGFSILANSGTTVLALDVIKSMHIWLYCDGKRVDDLTVREGNTGSGVKLSLIGVGNDQACVNLTAVSTQKFDEVMLVQGGGLNAEVGGILKVRYAFVGDPHDIYMTTDGIAQYVSDNNLASGWNVSCEAYMPSPLVGGIPLPVVSSYCERAIDSDLTNTVPLVSAVQLASVAFKGRVRVNVQNSDASVSELFHAGDQVGFKWNIVEVVNLLSLGAWVDIKLYDHNGNDVQTTTVTAEGLALSLASGGDQTSYIVAENDFSGAEITFYTALGVLDLGSGFGVYYGFVRPKPTVEKHHCPINASYGVNVCTSQSTFQLLHNEEIPVTWSLVSAPAGSAVQVTPDGYVTNMDLEGDYTFRATAEDGCYEDVVLHHGIEHTSTVCELPIVGDDKYELSTSAHGTTGSLVSVSDLTNPENILDNGANAETTYASYTGGLAVADNMMIVGVKTKDGSLFYDGGSYAGGTEPRPIRIGFVVEQESTNYLDLNALNLFNIRCFNGETETYSHAITDIAVVNVGIAGSNKTQKIRYVITVPTNDGGTPVKFNEFQLWKSGVLGLDVSEIKIYYPFYEEADANGEFSCNTIIEGANVLNYSDDHAYVSAENIGAVSVGDVVTNLSNIIDKDDKLETYATIVKGVGSGQTVVSVMMGHVQDYRQQVGVVIDNSDYVNVSLADVMKVSTYYQGQEVESQTDWNALGVNVVGMQDKKVLLLTPEQNYDEIRITITNALSVALTMKIYGIILRNDIDHDGVNDVRDPESCFTSVDDMQPSEVCLGDMITFTGTGNTGTNYRIVVTDQMNASGLYEDLAAGETQPSYVENSVTKYNDYIVTQSSQLTTDNLVFTMRSLKTGHMMTALIYDDSGNRVGTCYYTVHPKRTTWKTEPINTDWNEWNNWTDGSPYLCTDVIIPANAEKYPSLDETVVNGDEFGCDRIYFESRAAVEKVFKLNYTKAWVDVELLPNRYYMLAAPLKSMYTGDMFIPTSDPIASRDNYFTELTGDNYRQNRIAPRVWQRLYEKTADVMPATGSLQTGAATITETRWSQRFNALKTAYPMAEGYSAWVDPETNAAEKFTFRFPKNQTAYNYYWESGTMSEKQETDIDRTDNHRFTFQAAAATKTFSYDGADHTASTTHDRPVYATLPTVTVTAEASTTTFLVGNPFMSHIDVAAFLAGNSENISAVQTYDGNTTSSATAVAATGTLTTIQPMEAFFVTAKTAGTSLTVNFSEAMFLQEPAANASPAPAKPMLLMTAQADGMKAQTVLVESEVNTDVETLFDEDVRPQLALFTVKGDRAMDISTLSGEKQVPLGLYLQKPQTVKLSFQTRGDFDLTQYVLVDRLTGMEYSLDKAVELDLDGTAINRFVLRNSTTAIDDLAGDDALTVLFNDRKATVTSRKADIERIEVYSVDGKLLNNVGRAAARQMTVDAATNIGMLKIYRKGQKPAVRKFIVK